MYNMHNQEGGEVMAEQMTDKEREARREYHRRWREANPDKVRAAQMRFWAKQIEKQKNTEQGVKTHV